jgi:hypothetical protein
MREMRSCRFKESQAVEYELNGMGQTMASQICNSIEGSKS